jgi:hypothetical protein
MLALASVKVSTPFLEVPQNALRVLLTAYGVSPAHQPLQISDGYIYPLLLITTIRLAHPATPAEPDMARCRTAQQRCFISGNRTPVFRPHADGH